MNFYFFSYEGGLPPYRLKEGMEGLFTYKWSIPPKKYVLQKFEDNNFGKVP